MTNPVSREYSRTVIMNAEKNGQRTGQYLFNGLPDDARFYVSTSTWDPFYKEMSQYQIEEWLEDHVVFNDNGQVIGIIDGRKLLWGEQK